MIFGVFGVVLWGIGGECGLVVGLYEMSPYVGREDGVFNRVCQSLKTDLGEEEFEYREFESEESAVQCVLGAECDFTFVGLRHDLTLSYPVVSVRSM